MLVAGAWVAAVAVPVGVVASRLRRGPLWPVWRPWRVPWGGFEVVAGFLVLTAVVPEVVLAGLTGSGFYRAVYGGGFPALAAEQAPPVGAAAAVAGAAAAETIHSEFQTAAVVRQLWAGLLAVPFQLGLLALAARLLYPNWRRPRPPAPATAVLLGVLAWVVLAPTVLVVNLGVNLLFTHFEVTPDSHQLTRLGGRPLLDSVVFLVQACVAAPLLEEVLFRGVVLPWVLAARKPRPVADVPRHARPGLVVALGVVFAALTGRPGPVVFAVVLAGGLLVTLRVWRSKRRTAGAVYSSAALFAAVHSAVWPSPVPLFLFALGLGWLAVRTRGVLTPVLVHGLFNAVSTVYVLRGGPV